MAPKQPAAMDVDREVIFVEVEEKKSIADLAEELANAIVQSYMAGPSAAVVAALTPLEKASLASAGLAAAQALSVLQTVKANAHRLDLLQAALARARGKQQHGGVKLTAKQLRAAGDIVGKLVSGSSYPGLTNNVPQIRPSNTCGFNAVIGLLARYGLVMDASTELLGDKSKTVLEETFALLAAALHDPVNAGKVVSSAKFVLESEDKKLRPTSSEFVDAIDIFLNFCVGLRPSALRTLMHGCVETMETAYPAPCNVCGNNESSFLVLASPLFVIHPNVAGGEIPCTSTFASDIADFPCPGCFAPAKKACGTAHAALLAAAAAGATTVALRAASDVANAARDALPTRVRTQTQKVSFPEGSSVPKLLALAVQRRTEILNAKDMSPLADAFVETGITMEDTTGLRPTVYRMWGFVTQVGGSSGHYVAYGNTKILKPSSSTGVVELDDERTNITEGDDAFNTEFKRRSKDVYIMYFLRQNLFDAAIGTMANSPSDVAVSASPLSLTCRRLEITLFVKTHPLPLCHSRSGSVHHSCAWYAAGSRSGSERSGVCVRDTGARDSA